MGTDTDEARCVRCSREIGVDDGGEPVVCTSCLTALEDVEETHTVVALLERYGRIRLHNAEEAAAVRGAIAAAQHNLGVRLSFPGVAGWSHAAALAPLAGDRLLGPLSVRPLTN